MNKFFGSLLLISLAGLPICFGGAVSGHEDLAMVGFLMILGGMCLAFATLIITEMFDAW